MGAAGGIAGVRCTGCGAFGATEADVVHDRQCAVAARHVLAHTCTRCDHPKSRHSPGRCMFGCGCEGYVVPHMFTTSGMGSHDDSCEWLLNADEVDAGADPVVCGLGRDDHRRSA